MQYVVMVAMVGAAFWTGTLYQQVKLLRAGSAIGGQAGQVAGTGTGAGTGGAQQPQVQPQVVVEGADWAALLKDPAATLGNKDAKVVMVEFTDYQCPFCKRAFESTWPQIKKDYVDTGKMWYVLRDLPLSFHPNAKPGALAARCAGEQDKYIEMHDMLFTKQDEWAQLADASDKFKEYAKTLGLNTGSFDSCVDDKKYEDVVEADIALAGKVSATGTPTFYVNGKQVVGAQPISAFTSAIEEALGK